MEDVWRGEAQDLLTQIAQLQEENKSLLTNMSIKEPMSEEDLQRHEGEGVHTASSPRGVLDFCESIAGGSYNVQTYIAAGDQLWVKKYRRMIQARESLGTRQFNLIPIQRATMQQWHVCRVSSSPSTS